MGDRQFMNAAHLEISAHLPASQLKSLLSQHLSLCMQLCIQPCKCSKFQELPETFFYILSLVAFTPCLSLNQPPSRISIRFQFTVNVQLRDPRKLPEVLSMED